MRNPIEIRVKLRMSLRETINRAGEAIRNAVDDCVQCRPYGPIWDFDGTGKPVAVLYRIDSYGLDRAMVFLKRAKRREV